MQGHDTSNLRRALVADSSRHMVELVLTGCRGFGDDSLQQLLNHLPRLLGLGVPACRTKKVESLIMEEIILRKMLPLSSYQIQIYESFKRSKGNFKDIPQFDRGIPGTPCFSRDDFPFDQ